MSAPAPNVRLQSYQPATFRERGLSAPFTTPSLAFARVRPDGWLHCAGSATDPARIGPSFELLVPNPSGGRGIYVVPWANRRGVCSATVHDTQLGAALELRLHRTGALTPQSVRQVAREVAAEGFAGRPAAAAARVALERAQTQRAATRRHLLVTLIRHVDGPGCAPPELETLEALQVRAGLCLRRLAQQAGCMADALLAALDRLAASAIDIGGGLTCDAASVDSVLRRIEKMHAMLQNDGHWTQADGDISRAPATVVATVADLVMTLARRLLKQVQARFEDVPALLVAITAAPDLVLDELARPAWLLDGWEPICLLWGSAADHGSRLRVLPEMASLVPFIPSQAEGWLDMPAGILQRANALIRRGAAAEPAPGRGILERIARNEHWRAIAA